MSVVWHPSYFWIEPSQFDSHDTKHYLPTTIEEEKHQEYRLKNEDSEVFQMEKGELTFKSNFKDIDKIPLA